MKSSGRPRNLMRLRPWGVDAAHLCHVNANKGDLSSSFIPPGALFSYLYVMPATVSRNLDPRAATIPNEVRFLALLT